MGYLNTEKQPNKSKVQRNLEKVQENINWTTIARKRAPRTPEMIPRSTWENLKCARSIFFWHFLHFLDEARLSERFSHRNLLMRLDSFELN